VGEKEREEMKGRWGKNTFFLTKGWEGKIGGCVSQ
jgi:hypothetical protein